MPLSRKALLKRMEVETPWPKRLAVEPFLSDFKTGDSISASLDFHLGSRFILLESRRAVQHDPLSTTPRSDVVGKEIFIRLGEEFSLHPGQVLLGTTLEWFRFPSDLMAYVIGRSIWGRRYLLIVTASAVHPGSAGRITLELSNVGPYAVLLRPGVNIGQLFFHAVSPKPATQYRQSGFLASARPSLGHYHRDDLEELLLAAPAAINGVDTNDHTPRRVLRNTAK
jgi:dCTP deaminase